MKLYALFFVALALFMVISMPRAFATPLSDWTVDTVINDDKSADWTVTLTYYENVKKSDYFMFASIYNVQVYADDLPINCQVTTTVGTTILCDNIDAKKLTYKFRTRDSVTSVRSFNDFRYRFSVIQLTDKFSLKVELPLGAAMVEKSRLEGTGLQIFEPSWGRQGSDGRVIYVEWIMTNPQLGETFDVSLIYEQISNTNIIILIIIALVVAVIVIVAFFVLKYKDRNVKEMLPVLDAGERKVVEILIREKKPVDQRIIVKETDFSKPKVSRIIHDLEKRGIIDKVHKGRTNVLTLRKTRNMEKLPENSENKAK